MEAFRKRPLVKGPMLARSYLRNATRQNSFEHGLVEASSSCKPTSSAGSKSTERWLSTGSELTEKSCQLLPAQPYPQACTVRVDSSRRLSAGKRRRRSGLVRTRSRAGTEVLRDGA